VAIGGAIEPCALHNCLSFFPPLFMYTRAKKLRAGVSEYAWLICTATDGTQAQQSRAWLHLPIAKLPTISCLTRHAASLGMLGFKVYEQAVRTYADSVCAARDTARFHPVTRSSLVATRACFFLSCAFPSGSSPQEPKAEISAYLHLT
jgi:hypothetical protein